MNTQKLLECVLLKNAQGIEVPSVKNAIANAIQITPTNNLVVGDSYNLTAETCVQDTSGNLLSNSWYRSFSATALIAHTGATEVPTFEPANNAVNVSTRSAVSIKMQGGIDIRDVCNTNVCEGVKVVAADNSTLNGYWMLTSSSLDFVPETQLPFSTRIDVHLLKNSENLVASKTFQISTSSFTTNSPLTIVSTSPLNNSINAPVDGSNMTILFARPLALFKGPGSNQQKLSELIKLSDTFGNFFPITINSNQGTLYQLSTEQPLVRSKTYVINIDKNLEDADGNSLAAPVTVTFNTESDVQYDLNVKTIVQTKCVQCHGNYGDRAVLVATKNTILPRVSNNSMPKSPLVLSPLEKTRLIDWLNTATN